ncbi:MAG: DUF937 domain-containing protein [Hyphomicrobiaceae bacterium]
MNVIKEHLAGSIDAPAVAELSRAFGTDPKATRDALGSVLDEISRRMEQLTLSRGGLADLVRAVGDSHHEAYLKDPRLIGSTSMQEDGKSILDHVFWTKDRSRGVAARAARKSDLPAATIEKMLPSMAALAMGELTRAAAGPFDDILRRIPGLGDALEQMQRRDRGGVSGEFDREPDVARPPISGGDAARDFGSGGTGIPGGSGSIPEQRPLPIPGDDAYSTDRGGARYDDLSDILRRGGFRLPRGNNGGVRLPEGLPDSIPGGTGGAAGGTLYKIIRTVLGALLGFQSRGLLGWLVRLIVLRWGWGFVQRILGRIFGRVLLGR